MEQEKVTQARLLAEAIHFGQTDKGGEPRYYHVLHVGDQFPSDSPHRIVGYLHDALEDSPLLSDSGLNLHFGFEIAVAILAITRGKAETYFQYIERVKRNDIARAVKIEDLKHNMDRSRWPDMPDSYYEREVKALAILEEAK